GVPTIFSISFLSRICGEFVTMTSDQDHENPLIAVDTIIEYDRKIVLIERENPPHGWALPGGFVEAGESLESAARRETREETNLELTNLSSWNVYSQPDRDPRQHVVSVIFTAEGSGDPEASTDARNIRTFSPHTDHPELVFDHERILEDYRCANFRPSCKSEFSS
ncbi:MAG: NUDIX domain-containing protein, partial [bacterium]